MKKEKAEKTHLICPKCKVRNALDKRDCTSCKASLEEAHPILVADDWGFLPNYLSVSGALFLLLGFAFAKYSLIYLSYCLIVSVIMWPIGLRAVFRKIGRKPPGLILRTAIAFVLFLGTTFVTPSNEKMKAKDDKFLRDASVAAAIKANEEKAAKKAEEQEEKQRKLAEESEATKKAAEKKAEEEANKPKRSEKELLTGFQSNISEAKLAEFVESYSVNKNNINQLDIVVTNTMFTVDKQIRLQFVQKLWKLWSDVCFFNVKDIDSCRIKVKDIMNNTVAESSVWGGSIVKLKD
ncbi:hypothetical protein COW64_08340 [bacterium (Candidatus Blackallbacteria) CG18_big_fil_WC_8_21_14_2_50_49_26]|nr:MAG: hypothetical protein COW64_08340 [bacterium (Candidatus Blackallbacteria) CG18_big_fil_WC_8_21_14_2_50_49_26]